MSQTDECSSLEGRVRALEDAVLELVTVNKTMRLVALLLGGILGLDIQAAI